MCKNASPSPFAQSGTSACAPNRPAPSASRITARPIGWSRPSSSTSRSTRRRRACARRSRCKPNPQTPQRRHRSSSTATGSSLVALKLDGAPLPAEQYVATPDRLTIAQPPHRPFRLEIETVLDPSANTQLMGLYRSGGDLLHPMRGGGLPPHHLFPRPARRDGGLHHPHRGREGRRAGAARQRQPRRIGRRAGHRAPFRGLARSVPEAVLSVRAGRRHARPASRTIFAPCRAAT